MIGVHVPTGGHLPLEYETNMVSAITVLSMRVLYTPWR